MAQYGPDKRIPQTFKFHVDIWSKAAAKNWLRVNGKKPGGLKKVGNFYHAQQFPSEMCKEDTYWTATWKSRRDAAGRGRRKPKQFLAVFCRTERHP